MRRAPQAGQKPRFLHEKATSFSWPPVTAKPSTGNEVRKRIGRGRRKGRLGGGGVDLFLDKPVRLPEIARLVTSLIAIRGLADPDTK